MSADSAPPSIVEDPGEEATEELEEDGVITAGLPGVRVDGVEQAEGGVAMAGAGLGGSGVAIGGGLGGSATLTMSGTSSGLSKPR